MPQNVFHDVALATFDETDDFHPGPTLRALQRIDLRRMIGSQRLTVINPVDATGARDQ